MRAAESRGRMTLLMGFLGYGLYGEDLGFVGDLPRARASFVYVVACVGHAPINCRQMRRLESRRKSDKPSGPCWHVGGVSARLGLPAWVRGVWRWPSERSVMAIRLLSSRVVPFSAN